VYLRDAAAGARMWTGWPRLWVKLAVGCANKYEDFARQSWHSFLLVGFAAKAEWAPGFAPREANAQRLYLGLESTMQRRHRIRAKLVLDCLNTEQRWNPPIPRLELVAVVVAAAAAAAGKAAGHVGLGPKHVDME
jgi:hypothetical protein